MIKSRKHHYAWLVLIVCCAIQAGALGAISNCKGVFYDDICGDLGLSLGAFTLQGVFAGITSAAIIPAAMKILKKFPMHRVLFIACAIYTGMQYLMSFLNAGLFWWYLIAIIQAAAGAFLLFLPVPIILNRWFARKRGLVTAIASAFSGLSSMLLNPIYAAITEQFGWRTGYRFAALLSFLIMGPLLLFVLRGSPEEKGLLPYGAEKLAQEKSVCGGKERLDRQGRILMTCLVVMAVCVSCGSCFQSHLTKYGITIGMTLQLSALLPSAAMMGSLVFKAAMGVCSDKLGPNRTAALFFVLIIVGFALLLFGGKAGPCLYVGSFFCGISMAANVVLFPLLIANTLRDYEFDRYYSYLSMAISLTGVSAGAAFGFLFDCFDSYTPSFVVLLSMAVINLSALVVMLRAIQKNRRGETHCDSFEARR